MIRGDTDAIIADADEDVVSLQMGADFDNPLTEFERVVNEVLEDSGDALPVTVGKGYIFLDADMDALKLVFVFPCAAQIAQGRVYAFTHDERRHAPFAQTGGKLGDILDDGYQPRGRTQDVIDQCIVLDILSDERDC